MKMLLRNQSKLYYAVYSDKVPILDEDGMDTGEKSFGYSEPVPIWMSVSANKGEASAEPFGVDLDYTKTLVTDEMDCPISETSRLWVGIEPTKPYNYLVVRIARSLNHITYAIKEVDVS